MWDWGDGEKSDWLGPYESGETIESSHIWNKQGIHKIRVKAKDVYDCESKWSDPLAFNAPKNKHNFKTPFLKFLKEHPLIYQLIQRFLQT